MSLQSVVQAQLFNPGLFVKESYCRMLLSQGPYSATVAGGLASLRGPPCPLFILRVNSRQLARQQRSFHHVPSLSHMYMRRLQCPQFHRPVRGFGSGLGLCSDVEVSTVYLVDHVLR